MDTRIWDKRTKLLHLGLSITVTFQLFISLLMELPRPEHGGSGAGGLAFELHEYVGMTAFAIVLLHWLWSAWHNGGADLRHMFPWNRRGTRRGSIRNSGPEARQAA
ncbi:MAG: cytochrome b/b6 domain-containing protein [Desulfobacterales bacterium]|nr:MAG: cytochrome b/b6 domain-containing protein [Desulfobacterales bacterium]